MIRQLSKLLVIETISFSGFQKCNEYLYYIQLNVANSSTSLVTAVYNDRFVIIYVVIIIYCSTGSMREDNDKTATNY